MKSLIKWLFAVLVLAAISYFGIIEGIPYYVMYQFHNNSRIKINTISHAPPVTAKSRSVVRPSPDLLYSSCRYDVSENPLLISSPVPANTYFSVSFFANNTDNFFVLNDRQIKSDKINIILTAKNFEPPKDLKSAIIILAPTAQGVILFRTLIKNKDRVQTAIIGQKKAVCVPML